MLIRHTSIVLTLMFSALASANTLPDMPAEAGADGRAPVFGAGPDTTGAGALLLRAAGGEWRPAIRLQAAARFKISGLVARVRLEQSFRNDSGEWVEGSYLFPLPDDAAVNRMRLVIGERIIVGEIREKQRAREIYQQAKNSGRKASLVEQRRPNLFSNRVANIAPGETVTVSLEYIQRVAYRDGEFSLRFPMTVTPRYSPAGHPGAAEVWQFLNPTPASGTRPIQPISLSGELDMGLPLASVDAPYHPLALTRERQRYRFTLADGTVPMDRDFVLNWRPLAGSEPQAALFHERLDGEDYALLMVLPPALAKPGALARELIFVIDTSGSMGGISIGQARASLAWALGQLGPGDRFNIIEFNNHAQSLFPTAVAASRHNLARAGEFVRHLDAGGGTEMRSALQLALPAAASADESTAATDSPGAKPRPGLLRQVVFITDGAVGNEVELFREIRRRLGDNRLFTVGIGSAPNSWFMRKAAEVGRGRFVFIGDVLEVQEKMQTLFRRLNQTLVADFQIDWPTAVDAYPRQVPDLYPGEPLLVAARADTSLAGLTVTVSGRSGGDDWRRSLLFANSKPGEAGHSGVATVWARARIADLLDEKILGRDKAEVRAEILPVALKHQLVSPYTSFVAVERQPSRREDSALVTRPVPNLRPRGQSPQPYAYPRTATPMRLQLWYGLACLSLALLLFALPGRWQFSQVAGSSTR